MNDKVFSGKYVTVTVSDGIEKVHLNSSVHTFLITDERKIRITVEKKLGSDERYPKIKTPFLSLVMIPHVDNFVQTPLVVA